HIDGRVDDLGRIYGAPIQPKLARHDARYIKKIIDELSLRTCLSLDGLKRTQLGSVGQLAFQQQVSPAHNGSQGSPELVRHDGQEFIFHSVRTFGVLARSMLSNKKPFPFGFRLLALDCKSDCAVDLLDHPPL